VNSLLDEAARAVEGEEGLGHDAHMALREDVNRAREELEANLDDGWAEGAHALALFLCGPADLFEVLRLPRPVDSRVTIAERPAIEPLTEVGPAQHWAVLLLDGNDARLLEGFGDRLEETQSESSDHGGRTRRGGMSAQRYERSVGMEENEFLRNVAQMLEQADRDRTYKHIFVGTTERHFSAFTGALSEPLRGRITGRFDAGADWESPTDVRQRLEPLLQVEETHREREALDAVGAHGVRGIVDVLPALYERRVRTLLLEPGLEHPGVVCPRCRWALAEERGTCPVDGETMVEDPNLVEWAVEVAVEQDADVLPVRRHDDLSDHDGVAAALRF
jgi:peptide subunit release factor 1 (eRF1)